MPTGSSPGGRASPGQPPVPPVSSEDSTRLPLSSTECIIQLGRDIDSSNGRGLVEGDGTSAAEIQQQAIVGEATINVQNDSPLDQLVSSLATSAASGTEQQLPERNETLAIIAEENEESATSA